MSMRVAILLNIKNPWSDLLNGNQIIELAVLRRRRHSPLVNRFMKQRFGSSVAVHVSHELLNAHSGLFDNLPDVTTRSTRFDWRHFLVYIRREPMNGQRQRGGDFP